MFKHPNYYKNLRKLYRSRNRDQAISLQASTEDARRAPGTGLQQVIEETVPQCDIEEAASLKPQASKAPSGRPQAPSSKHQASSVKHQAPEDTSNKHQAPSNKRQASSRKRQAL